MSDLLAAEPHRKHSTSAVAKQKQPTEVDRSKNTTATERVD